MIFDINAICQYVITTSMSTSQPKLLNMRWSYFLCIFGNCISDVQCQWLKYLFNFFTYHLAVVEVKDPGVDNIQNENLSSFSAPFKPE